MNEAATGPQPLSLFNADALVLVGAVALILMLVAVAAVLALRARSRGGAIAGLACALLLMAFLPFWTSLLYVLMPGDQVPAALSSTYMWLTFAWFIHLERVFAIGALLSGIVYFAIRGTPRTKLLGSFACLALTVIVAIVYAVIQLHTNHLVG